MSANPLLRCCGSLKKKRCICTRRGDAAWRNGRMVAGLAILVCVVTVALLVLLVSPYDPLQQDLLARRQMPSLTHPLGLDEAGRDNLSRVMHGARVSLAVGLAASLGALVIGGLLGVLAGDRGGWFDGAAMGLVDVLLAFPTLLLALAMLTVFGRCLGVVLIAVALAAVPTYALWARVSVLTHKNTCSMCWRHGRLAFRPAGC